MPDTREASQRNLIEIFNRVVAESKGKIKIEAKYARWDERLDAATFTPRLHFFLLGNAAPQYIHFGRALFDDCADENNTEELAKAEDSIRSKLNSLIEDSHL